MIDQIKKEIERRIERYTDKWHVDDTHNRVRAGALEELLSFIDSLEKEPKVDLEEEIERIVENEERFMKFQVKNQLIKYVARHFYELGLNARKK